MPRGSALTPGLRQHEAGIAGSLDRCWLPIPAGCSLDPLWIPAGSPDRAEPTPPAPAAAALPGPPAAPPGAAPGPRAQQRLFPRTPGPARTGSRRWRGGAAGLIPPGRGRCDGHRRPAGGEGGEPGRRRSRIAARAESRCSRPCPPRARHLPAPARPRSRSRSRRTSGRERSRGRGTRRFHPGTRAGRGASGVGRAEPERAESCRVGPSGAEPSRAEPKRSEPNRTEAVGARSRVPRPTAAHSAHRQSLPRAQGTDGSGVSPLRPLRTFPGRLLRKEPFLPRALGEFPVLSRGSVFCCRSRRMEHLS